MEPFIIKYIDSHKANNFANEAKSQSDPWKWIIEQYDDAVFGKKLRKRQRNGYCMQGLYVVCQALNEKLVKMNAVLSNKNKDIQSKNDEINDLKATHKTMKQDLSDKDKNIQSLRDEITGLRAAHVSTMQELSDKDKKIQSLMLEITALKSTCWNRKQKMKQLLSDKDKSIEVLSDLLVSLGQKLIADSVKGDQLKQQLTQLILVNLDIEHKYSKKASNFMETEVVTQQRNENLKDLQDLFRKLESENRNRIQNIKTQTKELNRLKNQVKTLCGEKAGLEQHCANMETFIQKAQQTVKWNDMEAQQAHVRGEYEQSPINKRNPAVSSDRSIVPVMQREGCSQKNVSRDPGEKQLIPSGCSWQGNPMVIINNGILLHQIADKVGKFCWDPRYLICSHAAKIDWYGNKFQLDDHAKLKVLLLTLDHSTCTSLSAAAQNSQKTFRQVLMEINQLQNPWTSSFSLITRVNQRKREHPAVYNGRLSSVLQFFMLGSQEDLEYKKLFIENSCPDIRRLLQMTCNLEAEEFSAILKKAIHLYEIN